MPSVQIVIHQASGAAIVLSPGDRLEKIVTIECVSQRCASRNGLDKPKEVSLTEGEPMPEGGDQWMSLILPERSPQFSPMPPNFCSPQCVKDFLVYQYLAPGSRQLVAGDPNEQTGEPTAYEKEIVRITDNLPGVEYQVGLVPAVLPENCGQVLKVVEPVAQADGFVEGENPRGPSIF